LSSLSNQRNGFTKAPASCGSRGSVLSKTNQTHPLETLTREAEDHRLPSFPGEILLCRSFWQETTELAVQLLQDGIVEFRVGVLGQILLRDRNSEYVSLPLREFDNFGGKGNLENKKRAQVELTAGRKKMQFG
jgi:hypothetical protein